MFVLTTLLSFKWKPGLGIIKLFDLCIARNLFRTYRMCEITIQGPLRNFRPQLYVYFFLKKNLSLQAYRIQQKKYDELFMAFVVQRARLNKHFWLTVPSRV